MAAWKTGDYSTCFEFNKLKTWKAKSTVKMTSAIIWHVSWWLKQELLNNLNSCQKARAKEIQRVMTTPPRAQPARLFSTASPHLCDFSLRRQSIRWKAYWVNSDLPVLCVRSSVCQGWTCCSSLMYNQIRVFQIHGSVFQKGGSEILTENRCTE